MKFKTTQKDIKKSYKVFSAPYCGLQNLFHYVDPIAYTTRAEGWGCDVYTFGAVAITTGYAPFGKSLNYDLVRKYDGEAEKIVYDNSILFEEKRKALFVLISDLIKEVV